jgi:hypothetical protein
MRIAMTLSSSPSGTITAARLATIAPALIERSTGARVSPQLYTAGPPTRDPLPPAPSSSSSSSSSASAPSPASAVVKGGRFHFKGFPGFTPNLSPEEVLRLGSFGGYASTRAQTSLLTRPASDP